VATAPLAALGELLQALNAPLQGVEQAVASSAPEIDRIARFEQSVAPEPTVAAMADAQEGTDSRARSIDSTVAAAPVLALGELLGALDTPLRAVELAVSSSAPEIDRLVGLERGGIVTQPTIAALAESGSPEAVLPLDRISDFIGGGRGGMEVTVENKVPGVRASARQEEGPDGRTMLRIWLSEGMGADLSYGGSTQRLLESDYGVHRQPGLR
jgi:hypothetical protein